MVVCGIGRSGMPIKQYIPIITATAGRVWISKPRHSARLDAPLLFAERSREYDTQCAGTENYHTRVRPVKRQRLQGRDSSAIWFSRIDVSV